MALILDNFEGFDWDEGNSNKNWYRHRITDRECEEIFSNLPIIVSEDERHSPAEMRYRALGRSDADRYLFVAFTIRKSLLRVISAREMNRREERRYEEEIKRNS